MARGGAGRSHGSEDVRLAEGSKPLLALSLCVGPDRAPKRTLREQDEGGAEGLCIEDVPERDSGQVSTVPDEARVRLVEDSLHVGSTILDRGRGARGGMYRDIIR